MGGLAADMGAGEREIFADEMHQQRARFDEAFDLALTEAVWAPSEPRNGRGGARWQNGTIAARGPPRLTPRPWYTARDDHARGGRVSGARSHNVRASAATSPVRLSYCASV